MPMQIASEAEREVTRFLVQRPTLEEIAALHASEEVNARFRELLEAERERNLSEEEREEIEAYMYLEHFVRLLKAEAHRQMAQLAS